MRTCTDDAVQALAAALRTRLGGPRYDLWFEGKTTLAWTEDRLLVGVPNHMYLEYLKKTFHDPLRLTAAEVLGGSLQVDFALDPELFRLARQREQQTAQAYPAQGFVAAAPAVAAPARVLGAAQRLTDSKAKGRRWKRLDDFVVGACNRVAHAAALHLVEQPGQGPNPLVLHGPVGTGKSHLLQGIRVGLQETHPDFRVLYLTAEEFTNRFLASMNERRLSSFRKQVRDCDALLLDDLHFLAKKKATMEEFLHTFDALHAAECPLVVSCDCHPRLADDLAPELVDRLLGGVVWGLTPPDLETRKNLLRSKCVQQGGQPLTPEVVDHLAQQLHGNVRELEGTLHSLTHLSRVTGRPTDLALAREATADVLRHSVRLVHLADVERAVCRVLGLVEGALQSKDRGWAVSHPRMLAMYLARKHTAAAYAEIGQRFGGRNHSTAVAGEKRVRDWLATDANLTLGQRKLGVRELVERMERELGR